MKNTLIIIILIISSVFNVFGQNQEKTLILESGDKITGTIILETDSSFTINTSFGELSIKKDELKKEKVMITLKNGDRLKGDLLEQNENNFVIKSHMGVLTIAKADLERIDFEKVGVDEFNSYKEERWFFSDERLMDIWFDPTGFNLKKNRFYVSGLSWAFGLNDRIQLSTRFWNYFTGDFNLRPKIQLFNSGDLNKRKAAAAGAHFHTRGLPNKHRWTENGSVDYGYENKNTGEWIDSDTLIYSPGWVRIGATLDDDLGYGNTFNEDGSKFWFETFAAYTTSTLRTGGNGRINFTTGASAIFYPDNDIMPRVYAALDIDVTRSIKVMAEIFYDPYYVPFYRLNDMEGDGTITPIHFDLGFMSNRLPLLGSRLKADNFWVGWHFQRPFISFYWKF